MLYSSAKSGIIYTASYPATGKSRHVQGIKNNSADKVTSDKPEKLRFGRHQTVDIVGKCSSCLDYAYPASG